MAKRRLGIILFLLCVFLCRMPYVALAASTADAKEPILTDAVCELTVRYSYEGTNFANQNVQLYKIAEGSADFQYFLAPSFASSGLILNGVQTQGEWDVIRTTLETYILANGVAPAMTAATNTLGEAVFSQLTPGLYLTSAVQVNQGELRCAFASALIALPGLDADGHWQYRLGVAAKPAILPPDIEEIQWKILKLWNGDEGSGKRPQSIEVEIFRNGAFYATAVLSEENHWAYSWTAEADGADWKVVERNVPSGYTMTVAQRENTFVLTNTYEAKPVPTPPQTGDTANVLLYAVLMFVSGTMLVVLGILGKRNRHEETNKS